jgi:hypothetical protein
MNLTPQAMREAYVLYRRDRFIMTEERILQAMAGVNLDPSTQSLGHYLRQSTNPLLTPAVV